MVRRDIDGFSLDLEEHDEEYTVHKYVINNVNKLISLILESMGIYE